MKKAILTRSHQHFERIQMLLSAKVSDAIFWKPDFSLIQDDISPLHKCFAQNIDAASLKQATLDLHSIQSSWYRDSDGYDLSIIKKSSLGIIFESSIEIMFYSIAQAYLGFNDLANSYDEIIVDRRDDRINLFVANWLIHNSNIPITIIDSGLSYEDKYDQSHPMTGFRNLNFHFTGNLLDLCISKLLNFLQPPKKDLLFIYDAGKFDEYLKRPTNRNNSINLLTPIRKNFLLSLRHTSYWKRTKVYKEDAETQEIINRINSHGWNQKTEIIPINLLRVAIENFTLPFFSKAKSYLHHYIDIFTKHKPEAALLGTENSEIPVLIAYAARYCKVKTIVMHHGVPIWGSSNMQGKKDSPFDYYSSIGRYDHENYLINGIPENKVLNGILPWFSHYKKTKSDFKSTIKKRKALLLPFDTGFSIQSNASIILSHLNDMIDVCNKLDIEVFALKFREIQALKAYGFKEGSNTFNGRIINVFAGYGSLKDYLSKVDLVIGPFNSATSETILTEKEYYTYHDYSIYQYNPNIYKTPSKILYIASNARELETNISKKRIFQIGYDQNTLVSVSENFESASVNLDNMLLEIIKS
jgi:hypothetical protein